MRCDYTASFIESFPGAHAGMGASSWAAQIVRAFIAKSVSLWSARARALARLLTGADISMQNCETRCAGAILAGMREGFSYF